MRKFRDLSIKHKLTMVTVIANGCALIIACAAFVVYDQVYERRALARNLSTVADIFAYSSAAALEFRDDSGAVEVLSALSLQEPICAARIFSSDGAPFADYTRSCGHASAPPGVVPGDVVRFEPDHLIVVTGIRLDDQRIGTLYIQSDLRELKQALLRDLTISGGLLVTCFLIALALGSRIHRTVSEPILQLSDTAKRITENKDYSVRAMAHGDDELGTLVGAFNEMLDRIERDAQLEAGRLERVQALNDELKLAKERAEDAARVKSEFLANMSHEIRTPLTAVLGFADLLLEEENVGDAPPDRLDALLTIRRNGAHLLEVVNEILDLSKIEAGHMHTERVRFPLVPFFDEIRSLMSGRAQAKGLDLQVEYEDLPETLETDPTRLRQIVVNLVGNAIKFTAAGWVRIEVRLLQTQKWPRLQVEVKDTGIGVEEDQLERLFDPFTQADSSTTREYGGTGLGLTISRKLAQRLNGSIDAESQPGRGSTFRVTIPIGGPLEGEPALREPPQRPTPSSSAATQAGAGAAARDLDCRILVAEDSTDSQRLLRHMLKAATEVEIVENGQLAVDRALAAQEEGRPFDVILMDMQMPVLDGYEATRSLRSSGYEGPIIALTAHAMNSERQRCLDAGCDAFETKPIVRQRLIEIISRYLESPKEEPPPEPGPPRPMKIPTPRDC